MSLPVARSPWLHHVTCNRQAKTSSELLLKVVGGSRRLYRACLAASATVASEGDVLFHVPMKVEAVGQIKAVCDGCTSLDTWIASNGFPAEGPTTKCFLQALDSWRDLELWPVFFKDVEVSWRALLLASVQTLKQHTPPPSVLDQAAIFTDKSKLTSLSDPVKQIQESDIMSTTSALVKALAALEKETGKKCFADEKKELLAGRLAARKAICLEWAAGQIHAFVAKGPESLIEFAEFVLSKLSAKGMGSGPTASLPAPKVLNDLLNTLKKKGQDLAVAKAEEMKLT